MKADEVVEMAYEFLADQRVGERVRARLLEPLAVLLVKVESEGAQRGIREAGELSKQITKQAQKP